MKGKYQQKDMHPHGLMNQKVFDFPAIVSTQWLSETDVAWTSVDNRKAIGFKRAVFKGRKLSKYPVLGVKPNRGGSISVVQTVSGVNVRHCSSPVILMQASQRNKTPTNNQKESDFSDTIDTLLIPPSNLIDNDENHNDFLDEAKSSDYNDSLPGVSVVKLHCRSSSTDENSASESHNTETDSLMFTSRSQKDKEENVLVETSQCKLIRAFSTMSTLDVPSTLWCDDKRITEGGIIVIFPSFPSKNRCKYKFLYTLPMIL